jgi:GH15 family glucan-1,4-alpha-glucosidase
MAIDMQGSRAQAAFALEAPATVAFALQASRSWEPQPDAWSQSRIVDHLDDTIAAWRSWSELHQRYEGPWRELVHHSGRVLQALTFVPTGAIVAAPTTSLPESIGGERNWDYRYTWVRDASLTFDALWVAACPDEVEMFFRWMENAVAGQLERGDDLQIMFGVGGEHDLSERELHHLRGWRDSRPVRIGNGAWNQRQLDVYGELLGAARRLSDYLGDLYPSTRRFLAQAADAAATRWREKDQGIWEERGAPRDFLYSKLMCWAALDCAIDLAPQLLAGAEKVDGWTQTRDEVRQAIMTHGWSERLGAFTQAFGVDELDASTLMMPIVGFLDATDPRMRATIDAIADGLTDKRGLVYRYRSHDGLEGDEGTFLLCTFWLAHAQALAGEVERARSTFERAIGYANDVGLLSEEVDPASGELLGNFPQAFSHIGLVNAAWAISRADGAS